MTDDQCLFCRIVAGEVPASVVYETETMLAFHDIAPKAPVHVLVIPKRHQPTLAALVADSPGLVADLASAAAEAAVAQGVDASGYRILFNTGDHAGQEVLHVHAHVLGGKPLGPMLSPAAR